MSPLSSQYTIVSVSTLTIESNHKDGWTLKVKGTGDFTSGAYTVPLGQLKVRIPADAYLALSTSQQTLRSGGNGTTILNVDYQLDVTFANPYAPGYSTQVVYYLIGN